MSEDSGFFEEMNSEDIEEVELSATEESYENIEQFKESAVYAETYGVLKEVEDSDNGTDSIYSSEDFNSDISESGNVRVIYVQSNNIQDNSGSVSDNSIVVLDSSQFEILVNKLENVSSLPEQRAEITVSMNDYSAKLDNMQSSLDSMLLVTIMIFALCFGYMVKETVFRGV